MWRTYCNCLSHGIEWDPDKVVHRFVDHFRAPLLLVPHIPLFQLLKSKHGVLIIGGSKKVGNNFSRVSVRLSAKAISILLEGLHIGHHFLKLWGFIILQWEINNNAYEGHALNKASCCVHNMFASYPFKSLGFPFQKWCRHESRIRLVSPGNFFKNFSIVEHCFLELEGGEVVDSSFLTLTFSGVSKLSSFAFLKMALGPWSVIPTNWPQPNKSLKVLADGRQYLSTALILNLTPNIKVNAFPPRRCIEKHGFWRVRIYLGLRPLKKDKTVPCQTLWFQCIAPQAMHWLYSEVLSFKSMQWIGLVRKTYIPKSMHCPAGGALKLKDVFFRKTQLHRFFFEEDPNCIDFFWGETQLHRFLLRKDPTASICCVFFSGRPTCIDLLFFFLQ